MTLVRTFAVLAIVLSVVVLPTAGATATEAGAQVVLDPSSLAAGATGDVMLHVHNDGTSEVTRVTARLAANRQLSVDPPVVPGWNVSSDESLTGDHVVVWGGGHLAPNGDAAFVLTMTTPSDVESLPIAVEVAHKDGSLSTSTQPLMLTGATTTTTAATTTTATAPTTAPSTEKSDGKAGLSTGQTLLGVGVALGVAVMIRAQRKNKK
jgi:hypothetical protein